MSVKANLKIILKADETTVAETDDSELWQNVLMAINSDNSVLEPSVEKGNGEQLGDDPEDVPEKDNIDELAEEFNVTREQLVASCGPTNQEPFIYFDKHHWEAFKKNTPERGRNSIPPRVLALTILVFWLDILDNDHPTSKDGKNVLDTLKIRDRNPKRSIENCEWLQLRGGKVYLNPTKTSTAIQIVRGYILQQDPHSNS